MLSRMRIGCAALVVLSFWTARLSAQATLEIKDYVAVPMTGLVDGKGSNDLLLSRVNTLREEVGGSRRFFVSDLNGPLYIVDKDTKKFTVYLDFNGNEGKKGHLPPADNRERLRERVEWFLSGSRLHAKWKVLYGTHRGS